MPKWAILNKFEGSTAMAMTRRALLLVNSRKTWIVNPSFQSKVVLYGVSVSMFALLLTYVSLLVFFWQCNSALAHAGLPLDHPFYSFIAAQQRTMGTIYGVVAFISIIFGGVIGVVLSHRVAGPLKRMKDHLHEAAAGRAPRPLKFRTDDYFQELAVAYNEELKTRGRIRRPGTEANRHKQEHAQAKPGPDQPEQNAAPAAEVTHAA